jgi:hypothetical protein
MTLPSDVARCYGTDAAECADCARRTTREQARIEYDARGFMVSWFIVPPVKRPCAQRVERETEHAR